MSLMHSQVSFQETLISRERGRCKISVLTLRKFATNKKDVGSFIPSFNYLDGLIEVREDEKERKIREGRLCRRRRKGVEASRQGELRESSLRI
jgi:hypothetical protein